MPGWSIERCSVARQERSWRRWRGTAIHGKSRCIVARDRPVLSQRSARSRVFRPTLRHLADRIATRLRAKFRPGRTVTVRVRFADLHSITRSVTLDAPISATAILAEIAEELVRTVLADHPDERTISLLAISVSHLEQHWDVQLELPLGLEDEERRPGTKRDMARWIADRAVDMICDHFGWEANSGQTRGRTLSRLSPHR
jgi:DNA polymerase IV